MTMPVQSAPVRRRAGDVLGQQGGDRERRTDARRLAALRASPQVDYPGVAAAKFELMKRLGTMREYRRLFERLARWKVRLFCSDSYVVYPLVLAVGSHDQGQGETVALERNNGQQRHWTAALRRRSIVVSKSLAMIERRVALFAHLHVNKEAAPEMYRLPIQNGRLFIIG